MSDIRFIYKGGSYDFPVGLNEHGALIDCDAYKAELAALKEENKRLTNIIDHRAEDLEVLRKYKKAKAALAWIGLQPCTGGEPDMDCNETGDCITEWCLACYAKAFIG